MEIGKLADKAVSNHKNYYSCSAAVLCAFHEASGLSEAEAQKKTAPFAGGRAGKCGAVLSAEYVLKQIYGDSADIKISEFEKRFVSQGKGSVMCRDLMGTCRACVRDAAQILEEMM